MSFDLKRKVICEHRVIDELHFIDPDRITVRIMRPPTNFKDFKLKLNGFDIVQSNTEFGYDSAPDELRVAPAFKIVFRKQLQDVGPIIELSYTTAAEHCRRCHSLKVENDFRFDNTGRVIIVQNEEKMVQDLFKFVITVRGSNKFHTALGTGILNLVGTKLFNLEVLRLETTRDTAESVQSLIRLQQRQLTYQVVTIREILERLVSVDLEQNTEDPTVLDILVAVESASGQLETETIPLRVPGLSQLLNGEFGERVLPPVR